MSGPPRPVTTAREWAARAGIIPWYAAAASGFVQRGLKALYTMNYETRNLLRYSEDFEKSEVWGYAGWTNGASLTTGIDDPRGGTLATRFEVNDALSGYWGQAVNLSGATLGKVFTASVWLRAVPGQSAPTTLTLVESGGAQAAAIAGSATIELSEEWQRFTVTASINQDDRTQIYFRVNGTGPIQWDMFGAQLNEGSEPLPYTPTTNKQAVYDYSGNVNDAYLGSVGSAHINPISKTIVTQGTGNYIRSSASDGRFDFAADESMTLAAWVKANAKEDFKTAICTDGAGSGITPSWGMNLSHFGGTSGRPRVAVKDETGTETSTNHLAADPFPLGEWVHLVGVLDRASGELRCYMNGVLQDVVDASGVGAVPCYDHAYFLSRSHNSGMAVARPVVGRLGEFWEGAATETEIQAAYAGGVGTPLSIAGGTLRARIDPADAPGDVTRFYSKTTGELWTINQANASDTNDPTWTGEGLVFDGVDDSLGGLPTATESFAVEDGAYTESPSDYGSAGDFGGTLRAHGRYGVTLSDGERARNERAARRYES